MRFLQGASLALATAVLAAACSSSVESVAAEPVDCSAPFETRTTHQYRSLDNDSGVEPNDVSLDVYASPHASGCPVVVWVHGGSWQAGDKSTTATRTKAAHFISSGHVFVSVNYRLAGEDNDVRWPVFGDDVAAATAWVLDNAEAIGGDTERVSLIGHSSGAHLVSIVGTNPSLIERHGRTTADIGCVVSLDSVTHDLTDPPPWETEIIDFGFPTEAALLDGSPTLQAEQHATAASPDYLIVTRGREERIASSERLAAALIANGATATVADLSPYDHSEVSSMLGIEGEEMVTPAVDSFFANCHAV